ncbi:MAG: hypothetical protein ACOCP8_01990 [archaeon]
MKIIYHEYGTIYFNKPLNVKGWYITGWEEDGLSKWLRDRSFQLGFNGNTDEMRETMVKLFNGILANGRVYFPSEERANEVIEWIKSRLLMQKLKENG